MCGNSYWEPQAVLHPLPRLPFPLAHVCVFPSHHLGHHDSPPACGYMSNWLGPVPNQWTRHFPSWASAFPSVERSEPCSARLAEESRTTARLRRWKQEVAVKKGQCRSHLPRANRCSSPWLLRGRPDYSEAWARPWAVAPSEERDQALK